MRRPWFVSVLVVFGLGVSAGQARAEWQFGPFGGLTLGGGTTFINLVDQPVPSGSRKVSIGANVRWLGEVIGVEADVSRIPGFFSGTGGLVLSSHVSTVTGNVIVALPRRMAQYTLRPYVVGGAGLMRAGRTDNLNLLPLAEGLSAFDIGAGATGFLNENVGVNWDLRYFGTLRSGPEKGLSDGPERLSFWRLSMGVTIRP